MFLYFFFQAEDGIRDGHVTGVQTCALPILTDRSFPLATEYNYTYNNNWGDRRGFGGLRIHEGSDIFADYGTPVKSTTRSEERRVGKERRMRVAWHSAKKEEKYAIAQSSMQW